MPLTPASGFDRSNGLYGQAGTPSADGARYVNGQTGETTYLEEFPDSPTIERADQGTIVHRFKCDRATGLALIGVYNRGDYLEDSGGNITKVLSARLEWQKGDYCILSITAESVSFDPPPVEFSCEVCELNPALQKHPRYSILPRVVLYQLANSVTNVDLYKGSSIQSLLLTPSTTLNETQKDAGKELVAKMRKGISEFYLAGLKITFSDYSTVIRDQDMGGRVEDPTLARYNGQYILTDPRDPANPDKFIGGERGGINAFNKLAIQLSPMLYGNGITWLRLADSQPYNRTWFKLTRTWIGAPAGGLVQVGDMEPVQWKGQWDEDIYQAGSIADPIVYNTSEFQ